MARAFVGLGSNLANPEKQLEAALVAINLLPKTSVVRHSSLYSSAPVGYLDQPDFVNAVAELETQLSPRELLAALLALELEFGRTREFLNAPRTLDLDVLLYDDLQQHEPGLTIPHAQMHLRAFVLQPLLEIAPTVSIPGRGGAEKLLQQCVGQVLHKLH